MSTYTEKELEEIEFAIKLSSDVYGNEYFTYDTEEDRNEGLARLTKKIENLGDEIDREIYFVDHGEEELVAEWDGDEWHSHILKDEPVLGM